MNALLLLLLVVASCTLDLAVAVPTEVTEQHNAPCSIQFSEHAGAAGVYNKTFNDVPYCAFLGIPYAKPPVGELRFTNPVQLDPEGFQNYTSYGSICTQFKNINRQDGIEGSEDCLYLNVFTPLQEPRTAEPNVDPVKYPVLVFIHGGSFVAGSGKIHGVDLLMENELIVITLNYRLGVFGFLKYERQNITGNYGLKDQLSALQWIQRNVHHFGGDPKRVTLMGHSAGGGSVTHHLYHERARGLFHNLIVLSGSMLAPWAILYDYSRCFDNFIRDLDITALDELRELDFQRFFIPDRKLRYTFAFSSMFYVCFIPTLDNHTEDSGAYFTRTPHEMVRVQTPPQMPILISETAIEFEMLLPHVYDFWMSTNYLNQRHPTVKRQLGDIMDNVGKWVVAQGLEPTKQQFYQKMANMANIFYPIRRLLHELGTRAGNDQLYYLRFEYDGKFGEYKKRIYADYLETDRYGALHGDELGYIFSPYNLAEALENRTEYRHELSVHIKTVELIANFVKYGNPTPKRSKLSDIVWSSYSEATNRTEYLNIDEEFTMRQVDDRRNLYSMIWQIVYECLYHSHCEVVTKLELLAEQYGGMIVTRNDDDYFELLDEDIKNNFT
ncbi:juvenile hormone esterase-like [Anopheles funestus]|uniref:juvenile hormone esterase-like n=1 Tax=Anopheles funestus TaxID=62324 RepID=UPI0020C722B4|nr:juvenile hormone esterase-like [Anopheles funestus]